MPKANNEELDHNFPPHPIEFEKHPKIHTTHIPGCVWFDVPVHGDSRGWFKENWNENTAKALGLEYFVPVQNNISFNEERGVTRGVHAEPWDKLISVGNGRVFGQWIDLREGENFGQTFSMMIDPSKAIFVPRGVGNSFQALESNTVYTYLVNDHWSKDAQYASASLRDPSIVENWPIPLSQAIISDKDQNQPLVKDVKPILPKKVLVTGANGQLGKALRLEFPGGEFVSKDFFDIADPSTWGDRHWKDYEAIINAAAYTNVDGAETADGRKEAWKVNARGPALLAKLAIENNITLVHVSSDYVFDGSILHHTEEESFSPINTYGASKTAGDIALAIAPKHYIARTSWVAGEGKNFVKTMADRANQGLESKVVNDQIGRLTFASDLAKAIRHLLNVRPRYGTYNVSSQGKPKSWEQIAKKVYELSGKDPALVSGISTEEYFKGKEGVAQRPKNSTFNLFKLEKTGFTPPLMDDALIEYLSSEGFSN